MLRASRGWFARGCGLVGVPNIGKSTLFNALTASSMAQTGNYPFCTINPNASRVRVYDERLVALSHFAKSAKTIEVTVEVTDVAGLITGSHKGEGLGNKFLAEIRPMAVVLHVVRCFEAPRKGFGPPTPLQDIATVEAELILADLQLAEKRCSRLSRTASSKDPSLVFTQALTEWLSNGGPARTFTEAPKTNEDVQFSNELLSAKPTLFVLNVDEESVTPGNPYTAMVEAKYDSGATARICATLEEETAQMPRSEQLEFLQAYGIVQPSVDGILAKAFSLLKHQTFFTVGPKMSRAWSIPRGSTAKSAAGHIHSDFETHFVSAKVLSWKEFASHSSVEAAEQAMRVVGENYVMQDGDCFIVEHRAPKK